MIGALIGPYRVLDRLGAGGMGEVLLAEDTRLHRRVALKRLTERSLHAAEERARVLREARTLARLHHPGIAGVYDVVEDAGTIVIVMEFVEGETLASRLRRGPFTLDDALDLAGGIADALAAAHAQGVVHCDLKPSNILLTENGRPKILDFGLARLTTSAAANEDTRLMTSEASHGVSGSPGYMAPERLTGTPPDERGDVYGLGVVTFEMLTGRRPFSGADLIAIAAAALTTPPMSPTSVTPSIPSAISDVVVRAMARDPLERFASAAEFASALRDAARPASTSVTPAAPARRSLVARIAMIAAVAVVAVAVAIGVTRWRPWSRAGDTPTIVVKPFSNLGQDHADDALGLGISDDLTTKLAALPSIAVVSRDTTAAYLAKNPDSTAVARDLGAGYVVQGGFTRTGDDLHVEVSLTSADAAPVWTKTYTRPMAQLFALQRTIAEDLAAGLNVSLSKKDRSVLATGSTHDVEALADYSQGRQFLDRKDVAGNLDHAIDLFGRAVSRDPSFALAQAGLGSAYWEKFVATRDAAWTARAIAASLEALRLNPNLAEVHIALATAYRGLGQTGTAIDELGKALSLQPNSDDAHRLLGDVLAEQGRHDEALQAYKRAIATRPNYFQNYNKLAVAEMRAGHYAEATAAFRRVTELQPDSAVGFNNVGVLSMMQDQLGEALTSFTRAAEIAPRASSFSNIGTIHFWNGEFGKSRAAYERAIALSPPDATLERNLGDALASLREQDAAERAYERSLALANDQLKVNPNDAASLSLAALVEAKLRRMDDARRHADQALALAPNDANVYYRSAVTAALAGQPERALADLKSALTAGYSLNVVKHDPDLASLKRDPAFLTLLNSPAR